MWLLLIFVAVPIIEIGLFIQVGGIIGLWPTLAIVVLTAFVGTWLMRVQGMSTLARLQSSLEEGTDPVNPLAHGAMILVAGVLLLTPGFFTDALGLLLLIPPVRAFLLQKGAARVVQTNVQFSQGFSARQSQRPADYVEGEFEVLNEKDPDNPGDSGWTKH